MKSNKELSWLAAEMGKRLEDVEESAYAINFYGQVGTKCAEHCG